MIPVDLMAPTTVATLPSGDDWVYEPKWDGYRAAAMRVGEVQIVSRRGTDMTEVFPDLGTALRDSVPDGTLLDAEVVIYRGGRLSFDALQHRMSHGAHQAARLAQAEPASLVVFDIMLDAGEDIRSLSWDQRRSHLDVIGSAWRPPLQITPTPPTGPSPWTGWDRWRRWGSKGSCPSGDPPATAPTAAGPRPNSAKPSTE